MLEYTHAYENTAISICLFVCLFVFLFLLCFAHCHFIFGWGWFHLGSPLILNVLSSLPVGDILGIHTLFLWASLSFPEERKEKFFGFAPITNSRRAGRRHIIFESAFSPQGVSRKELRTCSKSQQLGSFLSAHFLSKSLKILYQSSVLL